MAEDNKALIEIKKRYLKRYRHNRALIDRLEDRLAAIDDKLYRVRGSAISDMPRGGTAIALEDVISQKQEIEERINKLVIKGRTLREEITKAIDTVDDVRYCEVLESYFIDCKTFIEIAHDMGYSERHIIKLYSIGISLLSVNDD